MRVFKDSSLRLFLLGTIIGGLILLTPVPPAQAVHAFVGYRWETAGRSGTNPILLHVAQCCYDTALYNRMGYAAEHATYSWNRYTKMTFDWRGKVATAHPTGYNTNVTMYDYVDGPGKLIGRNWTTFCAGTFNICRTHTHLESAGVTFYKGTGVVPLNQIDLWSLVTHEMGHSIRLEDLQDSDATCPKNDNRATMCTVIHRGNGSATWPSSVRTPNTKEDIDSANAAWVSPQP